MASSNRGQFDGYVGVADRVAAGLARGLPATIDVDDIRQFCREAAVLLEAEGNLAGPGAQRRIKNRAIDLLRVHGSSTRSGQDRSPTGGPEFDEDFMGGVHLPVHLPPEQLKGAMARLRVRERELVRAYYIEEMTVAEIAKAWGVSAARVSQIHTRVLAKLRSFMKTGDHPHGVTARQIEALRDMSEGLTYLATAERLGISKAHAKNLRKVAVWRLDAHSQAHAVAIAFRRGLLV